MASYGAVIEVSVKGQEALNKLEGSARKIESLIQGIKQQRNIFDQAVGSTKTRELKKNLENLVATFAGAKEGARQFKATIGGNEQTINMYSKTLAGLNHQLQAFRSIANNATVGTDQYRNAVVAANKVSNEFARTQSKAFKVNTDVSQMNVSDVIALGKSIPKTLEALDFYKGRLEEVLKTVKIGSNDFRALEEAITDVDMAMGTARLSGQKSAVTPVAGPATRLDTVSALEKRTRYTQQIADLEYKQLITGQSLVRAKLTETQQEELQNRLAQASEALAKGELDIAKRLTAELRNQRIQYERSNRAQGTAGSTTAQTTQKRAQNILTSGLILEQKALEYKAKGLSVDHQINHIQTINNKLQAEGLQLTKVELDELDDILNGLRNRLLLEKAIAATRKAQARETGTQTQGRSTAGGAAGGRGRGAALQNALIGGAFPLLFGGGPGAVAGGFAGGFIPGNPMMSIVTSAVGTIFDRIIAGARAAGEAVRTLDTTIQHMSDNALFSSKESEYLAKAYANVGNSSKALEVVQQELNKKIGYEGVASLQNLGAASSELNRAWADLNLQLQAALAGPLAGLLQFIADVLKFRPSTGAQQEVNTIVKNLKPEQAAQFQKEMFASLNGGEQAQKPIIERFKKLAEAQTKNNIKLSYEETEARIKDAESLYVELKNLERENADRKRQYAEQYADLVLSLQRQQADLNLQFERRAQDLRISNAEEQLNLVKEINAVQLQQLENESRARAISAGGGTGLAAEITAALDAYDIEIKRIGQEAADAEEKAKLNIIRLDIENERFKLDNAKAIARTNLDNQIRIQRVNQEIQRQNAEVSRRNYEQNIQVAAIQLQTVRANAQAEVATAKAELAQKTLTKDQRTFYTTLLNGFETVIKESEKASQQVQLGFIKPAPLPQMQAAPALAQPSTTAIDSQVQRQQQLIQQLSEVTTGRKRAAAEEAAYLTLVEKTLQVVTQFEAQTKSIKDEIEARKLRNRLAAEGVAPEIIEGELRVLELSRAYTESVKALDAKLKTLLPAKYASTTETYKAAEAYLLELKALGKLTPAQEELRKKLENILRIRERLGEVTKGAADEARDTAKGQQLTPKEKIEERIGTLKKEIAELTNIGNIAIKVADGIGAAFSQAFQGIITGTMTTQEALASFFQSVGDAFIQMATEIIAKQITMLVLQTLLKVLGAVSGGGGGGMSTTTGFGAGDTNQWANIQNTPLLELPKAKANGGSVRAATPYLVGERGPELFVPGTNGGVMSNSDLRSSMGAAPGSAAGAPVLNMSFETSTINGVEYVSRDQLEAAMAVTRRQAARDGANRGMSMTLDRLQQSPSTRRKVGI